MQAEASLNFATFIVTSKEKKKQKEYCLLTEKSFCTTNFIETNSQGKTEDDKYSSRSALKFLFASMLQLCC